MSEENPGCIRSCIGCGCSGLGIVVSLGVTLAVSGITYLSVDGPKVKNVKVKTGKPAKPSKSKKGKRRK